MDMVVSKADGGETYVPYTGNGFIGISLNSKEGVFGFYQKSLSLKFNYNPLSYIYLEGFEKTGKFDLKENFLMSQFVYAHLFRSNISGSFEWFARENSTFSKCMFYHNEKLITFLKQKKQQHGLLGPGWSC